MAGLLHTCMHFCCGACQGGSPGASPWKGHAPGLAQRQLLCGCLLMQPSVRVCLPLVPALCCLGTLSPAPLLSRPTPAMQAAQPQGSGRLLGRQHRRQGPAQAASHRSAGPLLRKGAAGGPEQQGRLSGSCRGARCCRHERLSEDCCMQACVPCPVSGPPH